MEEKPVPVVFKKKFKTGFERTLRETVELICRNLVDHPAHLKVEVEQGESSIVVKVFPHPKDIGEILGKKGRNISALRILVECMGARHGVRAVVGTIDDDQVTQDAA